MNKKVEAEEKKTPAKPKRPIDRTSLIRKGKLHAKQDEAFAYRFVNLDSMSYEDHLDKGYEPVERQYTNPWALQESQQFSSMDVRQAGNGKKTILMRRPKEIQDEYRRLRDERNDETVRELKQKKVDPHGQSHAALKTLNN